MMPARLSLRLAVVFTALVLGGCASIVNPYTPAPSRPPSAVPATVLSPAESSTPASSPTQPATPTGTPSPSITATSTPDLRPDPGSWSSWPIVPTLSARAKEIYLKGAELGMTPYTFSAVGDCQSKPDVFMGVFTESWYDPKHLLPNEPDLWETINLFRTSFQHDSIAVRDGLSAPSALDPLWADPKRCQASENPVACELRLYRPMIVFINLGTNWRADASTAKYEGYLRQIVDIVIAHGAIPVLSTKADNVEGDWSINRRTVRVAYDYDIPLINFWLAAQPLPNHGLDAARNNVYMTPQAWDARNYSALKTLDVIWRALEIPPPVK